MENKDISVIKLYGHAHCLFCNDAYTVVNYSIANANAYVGILSFKYDPYFPTNSLVIPVNVFMIEEILQDCDLECSLSAPVHNITYPRCLHSVARGFAQ